MICVSPAAHPTFCSFKLFTSYMLDACKQEREELVSFLMPLLLSLLELRINCCWEKKNEKKKRKNNFPSVFCLPLYCSKTSPSRPVTPPHPSSPALLLLPHPPLLLSSLVLTPHCTQVPAEFLQQGDTGPKIKLCESHCRLLVTIFTSPFTTTHRFPCFRTSLPLLTLFLPFLLRLILKAQHSLYACTEGKKVIEQERKEEERSC